MSDFAAAYQKNLHDYLATRTEESAYYTLENAGQLQRCQPDHTRIAFSLTALENMSVTFLEDLVHRGCSYMRGFNLLDVVTRLYSREIDDDILGELESLVITRNRMEAALVFACTLMTESDSTSDEPRQAMLGARDMLSQVDEFLMTRPDILSVIANVIPRTKSSPYWLAKIDWIKKRMDEWTF